MGVTRHPLPDPPAGGRRGLAIVMLPHAVALAVLLLGGLRLLGGAGETLAVALVLAIPAATVLLLLGRVAASGVQPGAGPVTAPRPGMAGRHTVARLTADPSSAGGTGTS